MFFIQALRAYPQLLHIQVRTAYGRKKLVTVWVVKTGQQRQVDIRDADKHANVRPLDVRMSKTISWLLRHRAKSEGIDMRPDGYARVSDLLAHPKLRNLDLISLESIVKHNDKQRFSMVFELDPLTGGDVWWIRANQGHTMKDVVLDMKEITSASEVPMAVHGTTLKAWKSIASQGLFKMKRNHIHLAQGVPTDNVISGIRYSSQILIFIDLDKALAAGIKFYMSANGVVLTDGNEKGSLPPEFFSKVENAGGVEVTGWRPSAVTATATTQDKADSVITVTTAKKTDG